MSTVFICLIIHTMINYLDPATNPDAQAVIDAGGDALQLWVDGNFSLMMFMLSFIQWNFALILILVVIALVAGYFINKWFKKSKGTSKVA